MRMHDNDPGGGASQLPAGLLDSDTDVEVMDGELVPRRRRDRAAEPAPTQERPAAE